MAAKVATQGESSSEHRLPPAPRGRLPQSVAAAKQDCRAELQKQWAERWKALPRFAKLSRFDDALPMKSFQKVRDGLTWVQASLLLQIRTGRVSLKFYLFPIKKAETDKCLACEQVAKRAVKELIRHYLLECPAYQNERYQLVGRNAWDM